MRHAAAVEAIDGGLEDNRRHLDGGKDFGRRAHVLEQHRRGDVRAKQAPLHNEVLAEVLAGADAVVADQQQQRAAGWHRDSTPYG